jgi:predicted heme/steroid binding protein
MVAESCPISKDLYWVSVAPWKHGGTAGNMLAGRMLSDDLDNCRFY